MELVEVCSRACVRKGEIAMTSHRPLNYTPCLFANIRQYTRNDHFHVRMSDYEARVTCWSLLIFHCPKLFPVRWKTSETRKCSSLRKVLGVRMFFTTNTFHFNYHYGLDKSAQTGIHKQWTTNLSLQTYCHYAIKKTLNIIYLNWHVWGKKLCIYGLSNHNSTLANWFKGYGKNRKPQLTLGTFLWCCTEITPNNAAGIRYLRDTATSMTNFRG